jgi:hypothetical protein
VSKELWICTKQLRKPIPRPFGLMTQPFELSAIIQARFGVFGRRNDGCWVDPVQMAPRLYTVSIAH